MNTGFAGRQRHVVAGACLVQGNSICCPQTLANPADLLTPHMRCRSFATCRQHLAACRPVNIASLWCCVACVQQSVPTATSAPVSPAPLPLLLGTTGYCAAAPPTAHGSSRLCAMPASAEAAPLTSHVLVHNGEASACLQTSGEWLQAAPRGAYTTARTVGVNRVFKLGSHVTRLATSANLMAAADRQASDHLSPDMPLFTSDQLRPLVLASMAAAVAAFERAAGAAQQHEVKLTMLLTWSITGEPDVWCHGEVLPPRPRPPVKAVVRGMPRVNAKAKDSEWVRQRKVLEATKPSDANEVILVTPGDGGLLEGLTSNFFAVADGAVVTAEEGVLSGTVRQLILEVCAAEGIPVHLRPPQLEEVEGWQGAFISSTSRLLLPLHELVYPAAATQHSTAAGSTHEQQQQQQQQEQQLTKVFPADDSLLRHLEAAVLAAIERESEPLPL